jgi:Fic family protein
LADVAWNDDLGRDRRLIEANIAEVGRGISQDASARPAPVVAMAQQWHSDIYRGARVPVPYFAGQVRDSDDRYPELVDYEVRVGAVSAPLARDVPELLRAFEASMQEACARLDAVIHVGRPPSSNDDLTAVLILCAHAHGEWVHIHPFANGNGRTARLWAMWVAVRYGLPPFIRLKPRPALQLYAEAARRSMKDRDHQLTVLVFRDMLRQRMQRGPGAR